MKDRIAALFVLMSTSAILNAAEPLFAYRSFDPELEETARFARLGVPLRAFGICNTHAGNGNWYSAYPMVWKGPGQYEWENLDRQVSDIIAASPGAELFCLVDLNSPPWLQRKMHFDSFDSISSAACSPLWREQVRDWLSAVLGHCEEKWGTRIKAYVLMAGQTTEWFETDFSRTCRVKNDAWRAWCAKRGFDGGSAVPDETELGRAALENFVYDPSSERRKIEYWRFHNSVVADALLDCARIAKPLAHGKQIGAFFGYFNICNKSLASQGHLAYERVAASPDVDFFLSPATYSHRACGEPTHTMTVPATLRLHGKRFLHEIDFWPHTKPIWFKQPNVWRTAEETLAGNTREAAYAIANHASFWWFDMKGGFYDVPGMRERIEKLVKIARRYASDESPLQADVLVVDDPDSAYGAVDETATDDGMSRDQRLQPTLGVGEELPSRIGRLSVGLDICSLEDLPRMPLDKVKVVVLPGTWTIDAHKAEILRNHVLKDGRTVIWTYAPGVSDGKTLDVARVEEWCGFKFKTPDVGVRKMDGWTSVYAYDYRSLDTGRLKGLLRDAGCHFWTDEDLPVVANERFAAIHVKTAGERTIQLPSRCSQVVNLLTGEVLGENVESVRVSFGAPDTVLLGLEPLPQKAFSATSRDELVPAADGDAAILGPVGAKLDRLIDHRVRGDFAKNVVFPEARAAFEKPDDDLFMRPPEWKRPFGMWKGEFWGKLMISACRMAEYTHDSELKGFLHDEALRLVALQRPDGYLGTYTDPEYVQPQDWPEVGRDTTVKGTWCWNLWCRKYTMWGLLMNWRLTGDTRILEAVKRSMDQEIEMLDRLGLHPCDTGTFVGMPSSSVLKPLLMLYEATREARYLDFARRIVDDFRREDGRAPNIVANAFSGKPVAEWYAAPWAWAKAYEMMSCCDGLLEYWRVTGDGSVLEAMKRVQAMLAEHETNPLFSVGYNDQFAGAAKLLNGITEPCDAIHWIRFNLDLFAITGEPKYADAMELAFYNAYLAGIARDGKWGGRAVRSHTYHHTVRTGQSGMAHQHCCVNNLPRTIADMASIVASRGRDGALCIAFYGDATAKVDGDKVEISGNYPYGDAVTVKVVKSKPGKVRFRIPSWSVSSLDRGTWRTVDAPAGESSFMLAFDMRPRLVDPCRDGATYPPPTPGANGEGPRYEWRQRMFTGYGSNLDVLQYMRTEPAAEIMRGPVLLAKSEQVGTKPETIAAASLHGKNPRLSLEPLETDGAISAWTLTIEDGDGLKKIPVCDFPSAGDLYGTGGMRFSVWF